MSYPRYIDPGVHEFGAYLSFGEHGLTPFLAVKRALARLGEGATEVIEFDGEAYDVTLTSSESGLESPARPGFEGESMREYNIEVAERAPPGARDVHFHVAPRWPDMKSMGDSADQSVPAGFEGVSVKAQGSNLRMDAYPELLRRAVAAFGVTPSYFETVHPYSSIFTYELYARIRDGESAGLIGSNGPMRRMYEHVSREEGFRELREDDRKVEGYYHHVAFDSAGAEALIPDHGLAKRLKHYHPKYPRSVSEDPLSHPKFCVSFSYRRNATGSVPWDERATLHRELDELLVSALSWTGIPARADVDVFVPDAYFKVTESTRTLTVPDDPLPEIRRKQEAVVIEDVTANPDLNQSDVDVLDVVADGGRRTDTVADESGWSLSTVYRVIDRLENLLMTKKGTVTFRSDYIADAVRTVLSDIREAEAHETDDGDGPWARFVNAYGIKVDDPENGRLVLRFGRTATDVLEAIREGLRAWREAGRDSSRYQAGQAEWEDIKGRPSHRTLKVRRR